MRTITEVVVTCLNFQPLYTKQANCEVVVGTVPSGKVEKNLLYLADL
jgi:hypothetical protein